MSEFQSSCFNLLSLTNDEWNNLYFWQKYIAIKEYYGMDLKMPIDSEPFPIFLAKINKIRVSIGKTKIHSWTSSEGLNAIFSDL
jgi:hypothetical protein